MKKWHDGAIDITHLNHPVVYALFHCSHQETPSYIGSGDSLERAFESIHEKQANRIEIILCQDRQSAYRLESTLIYKIRPPMNKSIKPPETGQRPPRAQDRLLPIKTIRAIKQSIKESKPPKRIKSINIDELATFLS
jgi:hypothetical protein